MYTRLVSGERKKADPIESVTVGMKVVWLSSRDGDQPGVVTKLSPRSVFIKLQRSQRIVKVRRDNVTKAD